MPMVVGALYVRKYFHQEAKKNAVELLRYVKEEFKLLLKDLDWMENKTKTSALEKADNIVDHIAYPDELLDDEKVGEMFNTVQIFN